MKLHRFIGDFDLTQAEVKITDSKITRQIKAVLRLEKGDKILLSDGRGKEAEMTLSLVSSGEISGSIERITNQENSKRKVTLYLAILKKENFELSVQKAVEAGVSKIVPVITERTIKTGLNVERLEKIIREASEQCGRSIVPTLSPILEFKDALTDGSSADEKVIFHPSEKEYSPDEQAETVSIFVGPEGGFAEKEIIEAEGHGYKVASLGTLILRGETAAIIATYRAVQKI